MILKRKYLTRHSINRSHLVRRIIPAGLLTALLILFVHPGLVSGQTHPMDVKKWNIFDINRIRTQFSNTGLLCDGNQQNHALARPPAFEYPNGSGISYGTSVGLVIGAPVDSLLTGAYSGRVPPADYNYIVDATIDEGSAAYWNEEHFAPYPEFVGQERAAMSDDPVTWPDPWPAMFPGSNDSVKVGSDGWPGFGPGGERLADQESFALNYAFQGTDSWGQDIAADSYYAWLNLSLEVRGLAWEGSLYEDFIIWVYVIRNIGAVPINGLRAGIHSDFGFIPEFLNRPHYDADRHFYDQDLQLAYGWDDNDYEEFPNGTTVGGDKIAWGGTMALQMPGASRKAVTYDAFHFWQYATSAKGNGARLDWYFFWNVMNMNDPHDSDGDGIDDDFWTPGNPEDINEPNGVADVDEGSPGYYIGSGADGVQTMGSGSFTLLPGESDTVIFATVMGDNEQDLMTNAERALTLYQSGWKVVTAPPAPIMEAVPGDGKVTLVWDTSSEADPEFEGYKLYRSADNGVTWGSSSFKDFAGSVHYVPLAQYDLLNGLTGNYSTLPAYAWFDLGDDRWVPLRKAFGDSTLPGIDLTSLQYFQTGDSINIFIDRDVINGLKYRYYVAAYDSGNGITGPLENTPATAPAEMNNAVEVVPHTAASANDLEAVKVVPNPYVVSNAWEQGGAKEIQFIHMPASPATLRIYNVAGELVRLIRHDGGQSAPSIATWDLLNYNQQLIAPGLYFYHLDAPGVGETTGKFVIIH